VSFILQVFHAPDVRTIEDASAAIDALGAASRADRLRLIRFILELTAHYPNHPDDREKTAWPEGLDPGRLDDAVFVFAVNLDWLEENLMAHVAKCAAAQALHVLDPQNGLLYRADGQRLRLDGSVSPLPEPRRVIPYAPSTPLPADMTEAACVERLGALLCERLAPAGFAPDPRWKDARRTLGCVEQSIGINAWARPEEMLLFGSVGLRCRAVTRVWLVALGAEGARLVNLMAADGWQRPDVRLLMPLGDGQPSAEARALAKLAYLCDWSFATAWLERWAAWIEEEGLAHLDRMDSPAGVARYALSRRELDAMGRRGDLPPHDLLQRTVLAGVYGGALRDEWIGAIRRYRDQNVHRLETQYTSVPFTGFSAVLDRFVAWLDTDEFAREAEKLRALA
jgi:hypothetical protein